MPDDPQYDELRQLIAALTERVYKLKKAAGLRPWQEVQLTKPDSAQPQLTLDSETEAELESKIGGRWLNRIGILAMLIGVSYFLKYAFDNNWIGPAARIVIGLAGGLSVVFWSEYVRRSGYPVFSYSLKAVGIGVLYLSLWAASPLYHLIPNSLAFFAMASVTAATAALALWQEAEIIAAFAAVGAFITPVALSTGVNNAVGLFGYLFLLNAGALFVIWRRPWIRILIGAYIGTLVLYSSWHATFYTTEQFSTALISVSALFAVFAAAPFVAARSRASFGIVFLALINAATYFFEVWEMFEHDAEPRHAALAAVALAGLYFVLAYLVRQRAPTVVGDIHWAIGVAFLIAAVPIGLDAPWITIGWFVQGAALIRIGRRSNVRYLKELGALALVLGIVSLAAARFDVMQLLFNERMMTFVVAIGSLAVVAANLKHEETDDRIGLAVAVIMINLLALVALTMEITDAWRRQMSAVSFSDSRSLGIIRDFAYSALWMSYGAGLVLVGFWKKSSFLRWQALILIGCTILKVLLYDTASLDRGYRILSVTALGVVLLATSFLYQRNQRD
jgi:uncharacterized membrane protein